MQNKHGAPQADDTIHLRAATFNASLNRATQGELVADLATTGDRQAETDAKIIQRVNPDVLLVNEFDYVPESVASTLFQRNYLDVGQNTLGVATGPASPIEFTDRFTAPSNTGIASGFDLNNDGRVVQTPGADGYGNDALGFGAFPGQYGMTIFSKYPIVYDQIRTFQDFLWKDMPGALLPDDRATPAPGDFYSENELATFRLASKSFWDVPVQVGNDVVHLIVGHPTPPTFDGAEDRNGLRNHDEIRFLSDYVTPGRGDYIYDDQGTKGGLIPGARFIVMGDMNADPNDGDSVVSAADQLLTSPAIDASVVPTSAGGPEQAALQGGANSGQIGNPAYDTADFADITPGNLRTDYVLPSQAGLIPVDGHVFWPRSDDPTFPLVGPFSAARPGGFPSSDHRLTWMDLKTTPAPTVTSVGTPEFLGEADIPFTASVNGLQIGGLSALTYDPVHDLYYTLSDDRSSNARFYKVGIDLSDGHLSPGDVQFKAVQTLSTANGQPFAANSLDPEGLTLRGDALYLSSEGDASALINPFVDRIGLDGQVRAELPVAAKYNPTADGSSGIRNNLAFEGLSVTPDGRTLYVGTEDALQQDGPNADLTTGSPSRLIQYDLGTGQPDAEYVYVTDPVQRAPQPAGAFATNGLDEIVALDNAGHLLGLERSFATGQTGDDLRLYFINTNGATDVSGLSSLVGQSYTPVEKTLLLDFNDLGIYIDNLEGMTLGPDLPDGRKSLLLVSDNNFAETQVTQFIALGLNLNTAGQGSSGWDSESFSNLGGMHSSG